jgi:uncharacterized protein YjiS (DUF1127 family)
MSTHTKPSTDYQLFLETFAVFTAATRDLAELDASIQKETDELIEGHKKEYLAATAAVKDAEDALKQWALLHPEWFNGKKSLTTPDGTLSKRVTKALDIENEALTTRLILARFAPELKLAELLGAAAEFLHVEIKPDREALEKLNDAELKDLGIKRSVSEAITPKPRKLDLGKAMETNAKELTEATA